MLLEAMLDLGLFETINNAPSPSEACNTGVNSGDPPLPTMISLHFP